jgi:hypothetical protein
MEPPNSSMSGPPRPWWMTALAFICLIALLVNVPRDLFFAATREVEVWLGFEVRGWVALVTAPLHWAIFGVGAWAFWTQRSWVVPWAAAYVFYVAISHLIWSEASPNGRGWQIGLIQAIGFSIFAVLLLRARTRSARDT